MGNEDRMTTERFFGGVDERLDNRQKMLRYVLDSKPTEAELTDWILDHTFAVHHSS